MKQAQKIRVGHSPDADDAFMFYALTQGKIPLNGFRIEHVIEDIESLNQRAFGAELEVTALSCHAFGFLTDRYELLPFGASVGEGYGPVVVRKSGEEGKGGIRGARIAVPGRTTTAYLVLQLYEMDFHPIFTPFDRVFETVKKGEADLGLLIHEGQLTYQEQGFQKVLDLGEWWQKEQRLPLPLGINALRKDLDQEIKAGFTGLFQQSLEYAMTHREEAIQYALRFGRGIDLHRGDRFVGMYVNDYSLCLGEKGRRAIQVLFRLATEKGLFSPPPEVQGL